MVGSLGEDALRLLRELGATRVRVGDTEVEFGPAHQPAPAFPRKPDPKREDAARRNLALASSGYRYDPDRSPDAPR